MKALLTRVTRVKRQLRDSAAAAVSAAEQAVSDAELARIELAARIAAHEGEATARLLAARGGHDLQVLEDEAERWAAAADVAAERLAKVRAARDAALAVLVTRAREVERLERATERVVTRLRDEEAKAEQKLLDDLGAVRAAGERTR